MEMLKVNIHSDAPIYRQLVTQLSFMIEAGDLSPGQTLPSARLLADNLNINRNTAARAYASLRELGLVEGRGRAGTTVVGPGADAQQAARTQARSILLAAARECIDLGLSAAEVQTLVTGLALRAEDDLVAVSFVECNADRAKYFTTELEAHLGLKVKPLVLGEFDADREQADLVVTTFFHLAEVRNLLRGSKAEVVAIVVAPHVQTLVQIASLPKSRTVGIWYYTDDQAVTVRDSLVQSGITNIKVLKGLGEAELADVDLVVIPNDMPALKDQLEGQVRVIEFGNVLDAASIRMVTEVIDDMREAKRQA